MMNHTVIFEKGLYTSLIGGLMNLQEESENDASLRLNTVSQFLRYPAQAKKKLNRQQHVGREGVDILYHLFSENGLVPKLAPLSRESSLRDLAEALYAKELEMEKGFSNRSYAALGNAFYLGCDKLANPHYPPPRVFTTVGDLLDFPAEARKKLKGTRLIADEGIEALYDALAKFQLRSVMPQIDKTAGYDEIMHTLNVVYQYERSEDKQALLHRLIDALGKEKKLPEPYLTVGDMFADVGKGKKKFAQIRDMVPVLVDLLYETLAGKMPRRTINKR